MILSENASTILDTLTTIGIALFTSLLAARYTSKPERQKTSRLLFEKSFSLIFVRVEKKLYSKEISLHEVHSFGKEILEICVKSNGYYHPSIKAYAEKLASATNQNYKEEWLYFSERFSMRYDATCKTIGLPLRNSSYRINHNQFSSRYRLLWLAVKNDWPSVGFALILLILICFMIKQ